MTWEDIIKQDRPKFLEGFEGSRKTIRPERFDDEREKTPEEDELDERVEEFYDKMENDIDLAIADLTNVFYEFEKEMRKQKTWMPVATEPKMTKFTNYFFTGINSLRKAYDLLIGLED